MHLQRRAIGRVLLATAAVVLIALSAVASGQGRTKPLVADIDGDGLAERFVIQEVRDRFDFPQKVVQLRTTCPNGDPLRKRVMSPHDAVTQLRTIEADGDDARLEVVVEGRSGASFRAGLFKVLRLDPREGACPRVRTLFRFDSTAPRPKPPKGYETGTTFQRIRDYRPNRPGREIRQVERLLTPTTPECCATRERISLWGYSAKRGKYVVLRSRVVKVKRS